MRPVDDPIGHGLAALQPAPLDDSGLLLAQVTECDGQTDVVLVGELDAASAPALRSLVCRLGVGGGRSLTVDVAALEFVDLAGLRALASCGLETSGEAVTLRGVSPFLARVIRLAGLQDTLGCRSEDPAPPPA